MSDRAVVLHIPSKFISMVRFLCYFIIFTNIHYLFNVLSFSVHVILVFQLHFEINWTYLELIVSEKSDLIFNKIESTISKIWTKIWLVCIIIFWISVVLGRINSENNGCVLNVIVQKIYTKTNISLITYITNIWTKLLIFIISCGTALRTMGKNAFSSIKNQGITMEKYSFLSCFFFCYLSLHRTPVPSVTSTIHPSPSCNG